MLGLDFNFWRNLLNLWSDKEWCIDQNIKKKIICWHKIWWINFFSKEFSILILLFLLGWQRWGLALTCCSMTFQVTCPVNHFVTSIIWCDLLVGYFSNLYHCSTTIKKWRTITLFFYNKKRKKITLLFYLKDLKLAVNVCVRERVRKDSNFDWQRTATLTLFLIALRLRALHLYFWLVLYTSGLLPTTLQITALLTILSGYLYMCNFIILMHSFWFSINVICFYYYLVYTTGTSCLEIPHWQVYQRSICNTTLWS